MIDVTTFADLFILGLAAHLFADWFLQTDWQAQHKVKLTHPAAWVHFGCHMICMVIVWPWWAAAIVAVTHSLIDTRVPLVWWRSLIGQKQFDSSKDTWWNVAAMSVAFWQDQAAHVIVLAIVARVISVLA